MSAEPSSKDPVVNTVFQDPEEDNAHHQHDAPHDQATEVAHAWEHFHENWKFFACFFSIVLLTVISWSINFGPVGNKIAVFVFAALRSGLIAYFMLSLFKTFSLVRSTFIFSAIFLAGMVFLSWWDSELRGIGDPIKDRINPPAQKDVP
jgi:lipopolysaccharide export LptBFGC system permease protein LptF